MSTVHLRIKGRVQGVFFRATAKEVADQLGVKGWIRNTGDDDVEALVAGSDQSIEQFIEWCRQGPRRAAVTDVVVTPKEEMFFNDFAIKR